MKVTFPVGLVIEELKEGIGRLYRPFYAWVEREDNFDLEIIIAEGFTTDFCSVPRLPFAYLLVGGIANRAGVVHDALYSKFSGIRVYRKDTWLVATVTRLEADLILYGALRACGVSWWKAQMMYAAVRAFGWRYYKDGKSHA
jgi:hypothetical protein